MIARLESESFDVRNRALEDLRLLAEAARPALEAHRDSKLLETRSRVRELLDELDQARARLRPTESRPGRLTPVEGGQGGDPFGENPPRGERPGRRLPGGMPPGIEEKFEEMRRMQAEMDRLMREGRAFPPTGDPFGGRPTFRFDFGPGSGATSSRTIMRDGAALTLTESPDGVTFEAAVNGAKETYKAKDVETLKAENPELVEKFGDSGIFDSGAVGVFGGDPFGGNRARRGRTADSRPSGSRTPKSPSSTGDASPPPEGEPLRPLPGPGRTDPGAEPAPRGQGAPVVPAVPSTSRRLGIAVGAVPPLLDKHLRLGGVGVVVDSVEPGSAAAAAGLSTDDVVTHCDGEPVRSAEDLRRILAQGDGTVVVRFVREGSPGEVSIRFSNRR